MFFAKVQSTLIDSLAVLEELHCISWFYFQMITTEPRFEKWVKTWVIGFAGVVYLLGANGVFGYLSLLHAYIRTGSVWTM